MKFSLLNYALLGFVKMPWNWYSVICVIVGKKTRSINRLVLGFHYYKEYHGDLF